MKDFLVIEGCNFIDCPVGGQLSFAKQLIDVYGGSIGLVGVTDETDVPVGKWSKLTINGVVMDFFAYRRISCSSKKPIVPSRVSDYYSIKKYKNDILRMSKNAITQAPELLIAIQDWNWNSLCYEFPGVENPLLMPRYKWGIYFAKIYENHLFKALQNVDVILASAGSVAIQNLVERSQGFLKRSQVNQFPTRVDTNFYKPIDIDKEKELEIHHSNYILVSCGRINVVKGWDFLLESFKLLREKRDDIQLYFIGDGEDRDELERRVKEYNLSSSVHITGYLKPNKVVKWLNIANLVLVGSHKEGWSISMLESLACGKAIVTTNVSGANEMVREGKNGYIVKTRDINNYANAIEEGLKLPEAKKYSLSVASKYALTTLKQDLDNLWIRKR